MFFVGGEGRARRVCGRGGIGSFIMGWYWVEFIGSGALVIFKSKCGSRYLVDIIYKFDGGNMKITNALPISTNSSVHHIN